MDIKEHTKRCNDIAEVKDIALTLMEAMAVQHGVIKEIKEIVDKHQAK